MVKPWWKYFHFQRKNWPLLYSFFLRENFLSVLFVAKSMWPLALFVSPGEKKMLGDTNGQKSKTSFYVGRSCDPYWDIIPIHLEMVL